MGRIEVNVDIAIKIVVENRLCLLLALNGLRRVLYLGMTLIKHTLKNKTLIFARHLHIFHQRKLHNLLDPWHVLLLNPTID